LTFIGVIFRLDNPVGVIMIKRLMLMFLLISGVATHAADLPYNETADANAELKQALAMAAATHLSVLVILGANWCPDCRALDHAMKSPQNASLIAKSFQVVKVDVGNFDRNLDIDKSYGNPIKKGIPAAVVLSPDNKIIYVTQGGELANARRMSDTGVYDFFRQIVQSSH